MEDFITLIFGVIVALAIDIAISVAAAQLVVWGLSYEHVNSGLDGPWLILMAVAIVVSANTHSSKR